MKMKSVLLVTALMSVSATGHAASEDVGTIGDLYTNPAGAIAIRLSNGFQNAISAGECATSNGYAGLMAADPVIKAALLTAKAGGQSVRVIISGCESSGAWWKISAVYIL